MKDGAVLSRDLQRLLDQRFTVYLAKHFGPGPYDPDFLNDVRVSFVWTQMRRRIIAEYWDSL